MDSILHRCRPLLPTSQLEGGKTPTGCLQLQKEHVNKDISVLCYGRCIWYPIFLFLSSGGQAGELRELLEE